jgi:hypothetical protein
MAIDNGIKDLLNEFGLNLVNDLRKSLKSKQRDKALISNLDRSINPSTKFSNGSLFFTLEMNDYWDAVNSGRGPTTKSGDGSLRKNLIRWIKTRKLKIEVSKRKQAKASTLKNKKVKKTYKKQTFDEAVEAASYAIAKKIHKEGYEGNHFYDEVIKDGRIDKLKEDIAKLINTEIIVDIQQTTKQ